MTMNNSEHIDLDFTASPPFFSFYRDKLNGRTYANGTSSVLQQITLFRRDPDPNNWNLPYVDPFGYSYGGVLGEFKANSSAHDSDKATSAYSLAIHTTITS